MKKQQVHNLIILDESGSMQSVKKNIIQGFNEIVQTIKGIEKEFPEQEHFISVITFNGLGTKVLHFIDPVAKLNQINDESYRPDANTPLFDALGFGLNKLNNSLSKEENYNVLVTILTDGEENASKEYSEKDIKSLIDELKKGNWTFTYIGADHDVEKFAMTISIPNAMVFKKSEKEIKEMFEIEKSARHAYSSKLKDLKNVKTDFYKKGK